MTSRFAFVAAALSLTACAASSLPPEPPTRASALQGLPPVELSTLDGKTARLDEARRGRPALVSLWASWCEACTNELPALARLDEAARKEGAVVLGVAVGEPRTQVAAFLRRRALAWEQLVDEQFRFADALGCHRVPATLVVDRDGRIVFVGGALDEGALVALREALARAGAPIKTAASNPRVGAFQF